jgi:hypothetical protein
VAVPSWSVVVPAKRLAVAKTRLRPLTGGSAHADLVLALLADTVAAALACPAVADVVVVTDEPAAAELVGRLGGRTVADEPDRGLNPALEHGLGGALLRRRRAGHRHHVAHRRRHRPAAALRRRLGRRPPDRRCPAAPG